jgi:hypothetical protein
MARVARNILLRPPRILRVLYVKKAQGAGASSFV